MDADDCVGLLREALGGDQAALARLVSLLTPVIQARVARTLLARRSHLGRDRNVRQEVEDLTQEIFLRVFRHLDSFSGRSALKTWIFRVALNHCRERLSRFRPVIQPIGEAADGAEAGAACLADPRRGPEELAVAADLSRQVANALALLPPPFREAVVLRDLQGLAYEEIAAVLGVRVGTVRSRIARGREQLRHLLETSAPRGVRHRPSAAPASSVDPAQTVETRET